MIVMLVGVCGPVANSWTSAVGPQREGESAMPTESTPEPHSDDPGKFGTDPRLDHESDAALDPDDPGPFALEDTTSDAHQQVREPNSA